MEFAMEWMEWMDWSLDLTYGMECPVDFTGYAEPDWVASDQTI